MPIVPGLSPANIDPLLRPFLEAADEAESQRLLGELIAEHVRPLARDIARRLCTPLAASQSQIVDVEDISSEVVIQLVNRLHDLRDHPELPAVANFRGYVATIAYNTFNHHLRQKYPERCRLKNRVRHVLKHRPEFALWQDGSGTWLCGLGDPAIPSRGNSNATSHPIRSAAELEGLEKQWLDHIDPRKADLRSLLEALFRLSERPFDLDELVNLTANVLGIRDGRSVVPDPEDAEKRWKTPSDNNVDISDTVEQRVYLKALWREIRELRPRQRTALLLNLRDHRGQDVLPLFALTGVASLREVADSLAMTMEDFAQLWSCLPLDDATIGARMGVTRQQVINLRKSARERLARRMATR